jgi:hypothetical protein
VIVRLLHHHPVLAPPSTGKLRFVSLISSTDGAVQFRPCFAVIRHFTGFNECLSGYLVPAYANIADYTALVGPEAHTSASHRAIPSEQYIDPIRSGKNRSHPDSSHADCDPAMES